MEELKNIINNYFELDIDSNSRKFKYVFARACYYKGCRDFLELPFQTISKSVKKNHATVIYGIDNLPYFIKYNKPLQKDYDVVMTRMRFYAVTNEKLTARKLVLKYNKLLFDNDTLRGQLDELGELIYILSEME